MTARLNLGTVLYWQAQFAAAAREFQRTLDASPKNPLALFDLGVTLLEVGQTDEAIRFLKAALEQDPRGVDTCYYLGLTFERQPGW